VVGFIAGIAIGYIGPLRGYLAQRTTLATERTELAALDAKRERFTRCLEALNDPVVLEMVAREFGLGKPGEKVFNIPALKRVASTGCAGEQPPR
jgi:cell division protein FtsB